MAKHKSTQKKANAPRRNVTDIEPIARSVSQMFCTLVRWGGSCVICYFIYLSIKALAGENTTADIGISVLAGLKVRVSECVMGGFGICASAYGWKQRKLRKDTVEALQGRNRSLEKAIDPSRSTSGLTLRGNTNPEDNV